jgi:hypothetical protein
VADVLIQATYSRRARTAVWSHQFQPNESKVSLMLTFPYVFLLKEIHIVPHSIKCTTCPAYVSVEVSRDHGFFMQPISSPICTYGSAQAHIKLQLNKSELVNAVKISFYKAADVQSVGLVQIKLLGYPMFENMLSAKPDMMLTPIEDLVSRSNMGWLRMLYMCMNTTSDLEAYVCSKLTEQTIRLCTSLLASPAMIIYDKIIEQILIKLSRHDPQRSFSITKYLLYSESGFNTGLYSIPHGILMETIVHILYQINSNEAKADANVDNLLLQFVFDSIDPLSQPPSGMILHCVACILYRSKEIAVDRVNLARLVDFVIGIDDNIYLKQAYNWILCSIIRSNRTMLAVLLERIDLNRIIYASDSQQHRILFDSIETLSYVLQSPDVLDEFLNTDFFVGFIRFYIDYKSFLIQKYEVRHFSICFNLATIFQWIKVQSFFQQNPKSWS